MDDKYVYWDDWQTGGVYKVHKSFADKPITVIEKAPDFRAKSRYEIKVYYKRSQVGKLFAFCACTYCSAQKAWHEDGERELYQPH